MSYQSALADLKQSFGDKKLLTPAEIAPYIGKSAAAQAKLRDRGHFPIKVRRDMGNRVVMSIYDVARYIGEPVDDSPSPMPSSGLTKIDTRAKQSTRPLSVSAGADAQRPFRRPPSLGRSLRAFEAHIKAAEAELAFDKELYSALESLALQALTSKAKSDGKKQHSPKRDWL